MTDTATLYGGIPLELTPHLPDGQMLNAGGVAIYLGTAPLSDVDATIKRLCINTFGEPFLRKLGIYGPTSEEILGVLRKKSSNSDTENQPTTEHREHQFPGS